MSQDEMRKALLEILGWAQGLKENTRDPVSARIAGWIIDRANKASAPDGQP